jgi:DNA-binding NtrC family response regulator
VRVVDLESTNGTWYQGAKVGDVELPDGAVLTLGEAEIEVQRATQTKLSPAGEGLGDHGLVGGGEAMAQVFDLVRAAAPTSISVLLRGESGTGKEVVARAVHALSGRRGEFVVFDAAATSPEMIQSQLFGHRKGAFTGADTAREGAFRKAHGGTLFLDELGELPLDLQPRLLRALERREVTPLGSDTPVKVDVRLVAATHRDLEAMVAEGSFREDLYHRLAVFPVDLPPLRDRLEDLPELCRHLLGDIGASATISDEALARLRQSPWPGNVRALRNALERATVLARGGPIQPTHLLLPGEKTTTTPAPTPTGKPETLAEAERRMILEALERTGQQKLAAQELGISESTLRRRLAEYREPVEDDPSD